VLHESGIRKIPNLGATAGVARDRLCAGLASVYLPHFRRARLHGKRGDGGVNAGCGVRSHVGASAPGFAMPVFTASSARLV